MSAIPNQQRPGGGLLDAVLASVLDDLATAAGSAAGGSDACGSDADGSGADGSRAGGSRAGGSDADGSGAGGSVAGSLFAGGIAAGGIAAGRAPVVLDCGGGSGSRAVPLAVRGAAVTVIDSSIDALAILARRAAEAGVAGRIHGVQADVESLADVAEPASADLVLVHGVLDATRDPAHVLAAAAAVVRSGGYLSVVVPNPVAAVLTRALAGDLSSALAELNATDPGVTGSQATDSYSLDSHGVDSHGVDSHGLDSRATDPRASDPRATDPRASDPRATDPLATDPRATDPRATDPRATDPLATGPGIGPGPGSASLDLDGLRVLVQLAGLEVTATHGLGAFSSSVPGSVLDGQPAGRLVLDELDRLGAVRSPYREIAGRLHLLARRPSHPAP